MSEAANGIRFVLLWVLAIFCSALAAAEVGPQFKRLPKERVDPKEFGVQDDTITVIPATAFRAVSGVYVDVDTQLSGSIGRSAFPPDTIEYYASLDIPAGAVIDLIGLNTLTDTDYIIGVEVDERTSDGNVYPFAAFSVPSHGYWQTDFEATGVEINDRNDKEWVIHVEQAGSQTNEWFGYVAVHWHRRVSPPPAVAAFNDVPTNHPFFQYVEALNAAGITGGCQTSPPLYCPDAPLTRGQMAVFLAKALGLHWPD